jgi:decaprenyl-phosphate phosphoribosyltransferase
MRKSMKGYNLEFLNVLLALVSAIIIVAYLMYCMDPRQSPRWAPTGLYYTGVFVMAGIMRYLQIIYVAPPTPARPLRSFIKTALSR